MATAVMFLKSLALGFRPILDFLCRVDLLRLLGRLVLSPSINNSFANELEVYHLEFKLRESLFITF